MRNWRELSKEEVDRLCELYPVTPNRELSQMFDISVDAIQDHLAKPNGWKKDRKAIMIGNRGGKPLTEEQQAWIIKHYKHTKNPDILAKFDIGESTLHRLARKYGLKKSKQYLKKQQLVNAEKGRATCEEYGIYDENSERQVERWRIAKEEGRSYGFQKGVSNKQRLTKKQYKAMCEKMSVSINEVWRKERMRVNWGLEQKTKLRVQSGGKKRIQHRMLFRRRGYIVAKASNNVYYTENTNRSLIAESRAKSRGLTILPYNEYDNTL